MSETIKFSVGLNTSLEQLEKLKEFLLNYIKTHECRDFSPIVVLGTVGIYDKHRLDLVMKLSSKANFVDGLGNLERKTRFTLKIIEGLIACGIELAVKPILA
jgi:hypothetical protein